MSIASDDLARYFNVNRVAILHVDDLGATLGANRAFLGLVERGLVTCGSIIVPGPWFMHVAECGAKHPDLDLGVHLTLTSEWKGYRWPPLSTRSRASGLIDDDGYFWRDVASLRRHLVPEAAAIELHMQVERALAAGLRPTHIDAHMAAAMLPELLDTHLQLAFDFGLWPVLPRSITWAPDPIAYQSAIAALDQAGCPVADHCRGTIPVAPTELEARWRATIASLPSGVTHVALHATARGEFEMIAPDHALWRFAEYDLLASGRIAQLLEAADIKVIGCRELQQAWLQSRRAEPRTTLR